MIWSQQNTKMHEYRKAAVYDIHYEYCRVWPMAHRRPILSPWATPKKYIRVPCGKNVIIISICILLARHPFPFISTIMLYLSPGPLCGVPTPGSSFRCLWQIQSLSAFLTKILAAPGKQKPTHVDYTSGLGFT